MRNLLVFVCLVFFAVTAHAAVPPNWPWRGVVIPSLESDEQDIRYLASVGVKTVHFFPGVRTVAQGEKLTPQQAWDKTTEWLDVMLDACKKYGVTGIIDMSQFPIDPKLGIKQDDPLFWSSEELKSDALELIGEMALHMSNRGEELAAYQYFSEPLEKDRAGQRTPDTWRDYAVKIVQTIRSYDPNRYVAVSPGYGADASSFKDFVPLPFDNIIYCVHVYNPHDYTHQGVNGRKLGYSFPGWVNLKYWDRSELTAVLKPVVEFKNKYNALIWVGEFSSVRWANGGDEYVENLIDAFDANGFAWTYFNYDGYHGWNPFYNKMFSSDRRGDWSSKYVGAGNPRWQMLLRKFPSVSSGSITSARKKFKK